MQLIRNLMRQWIESTDRLQGVPAQVLEHHKMSFKAISEQDAARARAEMEEHLASMGKVLLASRDSESGQTKSG